MRPVTILLICGFLSACVSTSYTNDPLAQPARYEGRASFVVRDDRGHGDALVLLALSGGGSRAAYFSGSVMVKLQTAFEDVDLLQEVDAISSVSGGSLPAAYYGISDDPGGIVSVRLQGMLDVERLSPALARRLAYNDKNKMLGIKGRMKPEEQEELRGAVTGAGDAGKIDQLYRYSQHKGRSKRVWSDRTVKRLMSRNYLGKWVGNWFWPHNIFGYWFTDYDRSDIMAQTFANNLYDKGVLGKDLKFRDLNPQRPNLIVNATNATQDIANEDNFGKPFTFTDEHFTTLLNSDVSRYEISRAVMASAAFPAVFNYMTLRDYHEKEKAYFHVFDGGNSDNLGLESVKKVIAANGKRYKKIFVILVDSHIKAKGISRELSDPRSLVSHVIDFNMLESFDTLLDANRRKALAEFRNGSYDGAPRDLRGKLQFCHIHFDAVEKEDLRERLNNIPTSFKIADEHVALIDTAVKELVSKDNACLRRMAGTLSAQSQLHAKR